MRMIIVVREGASPETSRPVLAISDAAIVFELVAAIERRLLGDAGSLQGLAEARPVGIKEGVTHA